MPVQLIKTRGEITKKLEHPRLALTKEWVAGIMADDRLTKAQRDYVRKRIYEEMEKSAKAMPADRWYKTWGEEPIRLSVMWIWTERDRHLGVVAADALGH